MSDIKGFKLEYRMNSRMMVAEVSPCVWMYPDYPLQLQVSMANGGNVLVLNRELNFKTATVYDCVNLALSVKLVECKEHGCTNLAFDPKAHGKETNRGGSCEACWIKEFNKEVQAIYDEYKERAIAERDEGARYITIVDYVDDGGDAEMEIFTTRKPTGAELRKMLPVGGKARATLDITAYIDTYADLRD